MEFTFVPYIAAFAWIGILLMIGTIIRAKVKIFQTFLFPAALIGGILGFIGMYFGLLGVPTSKGWYALEPKNFSVITYHLFAFGFVGIGLLQNKKSDSGTGKAVLQGSLWICLLFCFLYAIQSLTGYGIFSLYKEISGGDFFAGTGYLLGSGFTQGPGQAHAYATIWEETYHIANAISIGLAFSAVGFLAAGVVGVPMALYGIKKGWSSTTAAGATLPNNFLVGIMEKNNHPACAHATTHSANIDSLSFHFGLMFAIYGLSFLWSLGWFLYMPKGINGLGFGLLFCWAMFIAMLSRKFMTKINIIHLIDPETTKRITGFTVDFMICSVFLGITVQALESVAMPFILASIAGSIITMFICFYFGRRTPQYGFERLVTLYGYCTGTAASGLLLLRIVDPDFETPVAVEVGLMNVWAFIIVKPITWSLPFVPVPDYPMMWIFLAYVVAMPLALLTVKLFRLKKYF